MTHTHVPHVLVDVVAVEVPSQAVLVGAEGFVAAVDEDGASVRVIGTAVAITALHQRPTGVQHTPLILHCGTGREGGRVGRVVK